MNDVNTFFLKLVGLNSGSKRHTKIRTYMLVEGQYPCCKNLYIKY